MKRIGNGIALILLMVFLASLSQKPGPLPFPTTKVTAVTFVYEKDKHVVPPPVLAALNKLNREKGIVATVFEQDTVDGAGEVPEQYKATLAAAKEADAPLPIAGNLEALGQRMGRAFVGRVLIGIPVRIVHRPGLAFVVLTCPFRPLGWFDPEGGGEFPGGFASSETQGIRGNLDGQIVGIAGIEAQHDVGEGGVYGCE